MYLLAVIHQSANRRQWIDTPGTLTRLPGIPLSSRVLKASELGEFRTDFISIRLLMTRGNNAYTRKE